MPSTRRNTLVASDYGLLDEDTFEPKPNYWAALLWRKFMGTTVLVLNTDRQKPLSLTLPIAANRYSLTAATLEGREVQLNGKVLQLGADDALPSMEGVALKAGNVTFAPASITFLTLPEAGNPGCA